MKTKGPIDASSSDCLATVTSPESLRHCDAALARAFGLLGKRWNGIILGTLANGASGFADLKRRVDGISDSVLSDRLSELQGAGLILRTVEAGPPVSVSYQLSESGRALMPVMFELGQWASKNLSELDAAPSPPVITGAFPVA